MLERNEPTSLVKQRELPKRRRLAPSASLIDNHFNERIAGLLRPDIRKAIEYDRNCTDAEVLDLFLRGTAGDLGIFDIENAGNRLIARRVVEVDKRGGMIEAATREELQVLMTSKVGDVHLPVLIGNHRGHNLVRYRRQIWAAEIARGPLDFRLQPTGKA